MIAPAIKHWIGSVSGASRGPILLALALTAVGVGYSTVRAPGAARVETAIEAANPACSLERESRVSLGRVKMAVVKALVRLSGETEGADLLPHIQRVEATTYRVVTPPDCADLSWMEVVGGEMATQGWWPMVVERDGLNSSWVFGHGEKGSELDGLLVVEFGGNELEIVRLDGAIDRLMAEAVAEEPGEVVRLVRSSH